MKTKLSQQMLDAMSKDPGNWRGILYFNPKDPRLMVPKQNPFLGWTFNFGRPHVYFALGAIIFIILLSKYFTY